MRGTRFTIFAMLLLIAGTVALAACGGGDDDDSADDAASEQTSAAAEDTSPAEETTADGEEATTAAATDDDDNGGGEALDPCGYLTQAEVEAALGEPVQAPVVTYTSTTNISGTAQAEVGTCNYVSPTGFSSISITSYFSDDEDAIQTMVELACQSKETLDVGEVACWYDDGHLEVQLAQGKAFLDIFITSSNDTTAIGETLAENAVAKL